jgi:hypothetical protein
MVGNVGKWWGNVGKWWGNGGKCEKIVMKLEKLNKN